MPPNPWDSALLVFNMNFHYPLLGCCMRFYQPMWIYLRLDAFYFLHSYITLFRYPSVVMLLYHGSLVNEKSQWDQTQCICLSSSLFSIYCLKSFFVLRVSNSPHVSVCRLTSYIFWTFEHWHEKPSVNWRMKIDDHVFLSIKTRWCFLFDGPIIGILLYEKNEKWQSKKAPSLSCGYVQSAVIPVCR